MVPPVVLNNTDFPLGTIIAVNRNAMTELRLEINVSDVNVEDPVLVRAQLSVLGDTSPTFACAEPAIATGQPLRQPVQLQIQTQELKPFMCTKVEVFASSEFVGECPPVSDQDKRGFDFPANRGDLARAQYWIWEMSGDPLTNAAAAQRLIQSCQTEIATQNNPMPVVQ